MSPHLRTLLDDAAYDGDRPVTYDLAAVRSEARRSIWRRRIFTAGGAVGAAAVITSVALVVSGGGGGGIAPADGATDGAASAEGAMMSSTDAGAELLVEALAAQGYTASAERGMGVAADGPDGGGSASVSVVDITKGEGSGAGVVATFTRLDLMNDLAGEPQEPLEPLADGASAPVQVDLADAGLCAALPASDWTGASWSSCIERDVTELGTYYEASGSDAEGEAVGATLIRPDGSGVSVAVSVAPYDRPVPDGTEVLSEVPLTYDELAALLPALAAADPSAPDDVGEPTAVPPIPDGVTPPPPPSPGATGLRPGVDEVGFAPLTDALAAKGLTIDGGSSRGAASEGVDGGHSMTQLYSIIDEAGRQGTAAVLSASSFDAAGWSTEAWCAVTPKDPIEQDSFVWEPVGDVTCADLAEGTPVVLVHHEHHGMEAIGATLVREDGSIISLAINEAPFLDGEPLESLPFDADEILDVLLALSDANPPA